MVNLYNLDYREGFKKIEDGSMKRRVLYKNEGDLSEKEYLEKYYLVTNDGHIYRKYNMTEVCSCLDYKGYICVRLKVPNFSKNKDGRKNYRVHRLVAMFYLNDYSDDLQVNHKNGIKTDNRVENLEMVTNQQNALHAWRVLDSSKRRAKIKEIAKGYDLSEMIEKSAKKKRKKTARCDDNWNVLEIYEGCGKAGIANGVTQSAISYAVIHKTLCKGFYWKYV